jgi:NAD(P)-dependent dehydrogenase (short-subunit alcohol dehydrogenase family)
MSVAAEGQCHRLLGKSAIVAGGASGIGAATSRRLVDEGALVTISDVNGAAAEALAKELGDSARGVEFDAEDVSSVEQLVASAVEWTGRLDILHNNAAIMAPEHIGQDTTPVDIDFDVWDRTFDVNVRGYLAGIKYAVPHMIAGGGGSIVLTASGSAKLGDLSNIAYGASKGAIITLTKYVATIYGQQGIRCNAINPGLIRTEGGKRNVAGPLVGIMESNTLVPRLGQPEDIAACVAYLASDDAAFVTGAVIDVDGGMLCHMPYLSDVTRLFGTGQAFGTTSSAG